MNLIIVRHGESEAAEKRMVEGRADFKLTDRGRRQAELLSERIRSSWEVKRIYSSPLKRALETAEIIAGAFSLSVTPEEDLMEFNNGLLAGVTMSEVERLYPPVLDIPSHGSVYRQETRIQFRMRAENILSKVLYENSEQSTVVMVTHGGMINQLFRAFMKLPMDHQAFVASEDGCIHHWLILGENRGILMTNSLEHLE